ncbi:MAG: transketolase [Candidatus Omnitrophica bacterium]|nr:transketolase [Candidatus Omnitrophota bacterium]
MNKKDLGALKEKARQYRKQILKVVSAAGSGHPGGSLSAVEILTSLYCYKMRHDPARPGWRMRDRFIMSKGHASPALYVTLADRGFFSEEELATFRKIDSRLQGHVHTSVPGVELSTGSLGQGLSVANGVALAAKIRKKDFKVYCLLGDGEIQEGQIWEAAMTAPQHELDNLCAILDANGLQQNEPVAKVKDLEPLADKWKDFGWNVLEVDGHDLGELTDALDQSGLVKGRPTFIIARTVKGKGVSFMEGKTEWHGKAPEKEELEKALEELGF